MSERLHRRDSAEPPLEPAAVNDAAFAFRCFAEGVRELAHGYASETTNGKALPFPAGRFVSENEQRLLDPDLRPELELAIALLDA